MTIFQNTVYSFEKLHGITMKIIGIIPSRMGSSRFPNKPLEMILDLPMIEHVRRRACLIPGLSDVIIATCDEAIRETVAFHGGKSVMTSLDHTRPSSRVAEAAKNLQADAYLMIQGDEPLLLPDEVGKLIEKYTSMPKKPAALNLIHQIVDKEEIQDPNVVKVAISHSGRMINLSRSPIPKAFTTTNVTYYKQSGLILFSAQALQDFANFSEGPLEIAESVDMLRFLENDIEVVSHLSKLETIGIDLPIHISKAVNIIQNDEIHNSLYKKIISMK